MKLTHFALMMALGLLGLTTWLAWDARNDAKGAHNQLELVQQQKGSVANPAAMQEKENQILMQQMAGKKGGAPAPAPPSTGMPAPAPAPTPVSPAVGAGKRIDMSHTGTAALEAPPPPLSPRQQMVLSVPAIAKVKESHKEHGFVVITAGSNQKLEVGMTFAVRRGPGIIGRIKIDVVEDSDAVGNIENGSIPAGVSIESGDDVIQNLPPEA
jgi:hypothetical protein